MHFFPDSELHRDLKEFSTSELFMLKSNRIRHVYAFGKLIYFQFKVISGFLHEAISLTSQGYLWGRNSDPPTILALSSCALPQSTRPEGKKWHMNVTKPKWHRGRACFCRFAASYVRFLMNDAQCICISSILSLSKLQ